eukprot:Skav203771  [mRNA]  locus=scaffold206:191880:212068:+ [translate_table: standard]
MVVVEDTECLKHVLMTSCSVKGKDFCQLLADEVPRFQEFMKLSSVDAMLPEDQSQLPRCLRISLRGASNLRVPVDVWHVPISRSDGRFHLVALREDSEAKTVPEAVGHGDGDSSCRSPVARRDEDAESSSSWSQQSTSSVLQCFPELVPGCNWLPAHLSFTRGPQTSESSMPSLRRLLRPTDWDTVRRKLKDIAAGAETGGLRLRPGQLPRGAGLRLAPMFAGAPEAPPSPSPVHPALRAVDLLAPPQVHPALRAVDLLAPPQVLIHDLAHVGVMSRSRCFLFFGDLIPEAPLAPLGLSWQDSGARLSALPSWRELAILDAASPLAQVKFLPHDKKLQAFALGLDDGPQVLRLRCHREGALPTLVASYRFQHELDRRHLLEKGIFTWLVEDADCPFGVRYLHSFEALRCLGFQGDFWLPSDQRQAMHLLGNSVSPVQALWALAHSRSVSADLTAIVRSWILEPAPLAQQRIIDFQGSSYAVMDMPHGRPHFLGDQVVAATCDGEVFPVPSGLVHSLKRATCTLPVAAPWTCVEFGRWLQDDGLLVVIRVQGLKIVLDNGTIPLSPFSSLSVLEPLLQSYCPGPRDALPIWLWCRNESRTFQLPGASLVEGRVYLTAGTEVRAVDIADNQDLSACVQVAFPRCFSSLALVTDVQGQQVALSVRPPPGSAFRCEFYPQRVQVEPHGSFLVDPLSTVCALARLVSLAHYGGRASVRLTCNGRLLSPGMTVGVVAPLGVLRARVFALPGGAPSLALQMENLQTLLVQHGHPASSSKEKSDEIFNKLGQAKLKLISESKTPWIQLKAEASAHKIVLIPPENRGQAKSSDDPLLANDPWLAGRNQAARTAKKKQSPKPPPSRVDVSFFHADGCPVAQIELTKLLQGSQGLVVTDLKSFKDHVDSALAANMTVGPSGVLLLGVDPLQIVSTPSARVQALAVPGWLGASPTAFKATLIQTGDSPLETRTVQELKLPEARQTHRVVQLHVFRDETDSWSLLISQGIVSYLKHIGCQHFGSISQTWSLEFYHRRKKADPEGASYYHGYLKIDATKLEPLLKLGGISGFYPSPRAEGRGPDPRFRTIMLRGLTLAEARSAAAKVTSLGLTRGKHGYGVRVHLSDYSEARRKLFPQGVESSDSDPGGPRKFQLLGVPDSVNRSVLKQALAALGWPARVSRTAGFRAWSVFATIDPPARCFPLREAQVMIVEATQAQSSGPILGTTSKHFRSNVVHLGPLASQAAPVCPQSVATKFDQLDTQATARVTALEQKFESLAESVSSAQAATSKSVSELAQSVGSLHTHVKEQSQAYDQQLKAMFGQLAKKQDDGFEALERASELTLKGLRQENLNAMKTMRQEFEASYKELRDIFTHSPKARKVTPEGSESLPAADMAQLVDEWGCSILALSESSHSKRAVAAVLSEYRACGYRLSLTDPVPDRFSVADEAGSYRGLSRGVAVASKFPLFTPRPTQVPPLAWQSQRLLCTVVQMGQVPLHLVTVYLHPNPTPGSFRHRLNSQLLDWAWAILAEISGPACLVGDFNSPWQSYDIGESMVAKGWVDLHAFWAAQKGQVPQPTCKQATRHTSLLANPAFRPFVSDVYVDFEDSLDSHSVLLAKVSCPTCNPLVWKWLLPQALDQCSFDSRLSSETPSQEWLDTFRSMLQAGDLSKAFSYWSQGAEDVLVRAARLNDSPVPVRRFSGRAQQLHPVRRPLAAPRFKQGRSSDFCVSHQANTLIVRQVQKQARRLQNLGRLMRSPQRPITNTKINELWNAVLASTGFGHSFTRWALERLDIGFLSPTSGCVASLTQVVLDHANQLASQSWRARRKHFSDCLENSWSCDGGRLPFKVVRESPLPPVQELEMVFPLLLAPQRWSPTGPASRLVQVLDALGWAYQSAGTFADDAGRTFHVTLSPLSHVEALLLASWSQEVARRVAHRKYLAALETVDPHLTTCFRHLPMSERALLQRQHSGAFFTGEFLKHTGAPTQCRFCGQEDTRLHRLMHCPRVQTWLHSFPLLVHNLDVLPEHTWAHGLWDEPPLWRAWQAHLDSFTLPDIVRSEDASPAYLYSDGTCSRPKCRHASLAASAVIKADPSGAFTIVWTGRLPGSMQTPYRAELLAGAVAFASHRVVHLFSDCLAFVKVARRLLSAAQQSTRPVLPSHHLDLWTFFWLSLQGADVTQSFITWVPSHRDYRRLDGLHRIHAWFNGCADKVAKESARLAVCPLFTGLAAQVDLLRQAATQMATYQAGVAKMFANERVERSARVSSLRDTLVPQSPVCSPVSVDLDLSAIPCPAFARQFLRWLLSLQWTASALDPVAQSTWVDTSFLELFWAFVWSTGILPPFRHDGVWVLPQDDPLLAFVQPSFCVLFRSWKRQLDLLIRLGFVPCWTSVLSVTASAGLLGASFPCPGVAGRALVPHESLMSLAAALQCAHRLSALALPVTVHPALRAVDLLAPPQAVAPVSSLSFPGFPCSEELRRALALEGLQSFQRLGAAVEHDQNLTFEDIDEFLRRWGHTLPLRDRQQIRAAAQPALTLGEQRGEQRGERMGLVVMGHGHGYVVYG